MIQLKNGATSRDSRLTRIVQFDERSKAYPVREVLNSTVPRSYTWSCASHLDQGSEGACVGFAFAHELIAKPSIVPGIDGKFALEKLYWEAQKNDDWEGGSYPKASPYYDGTSVLAGIKTVQKLGYIKEYRWAFTLDDLILSVGRLGPAVLGLNWYEGMFEPHDCGYLHVTGEIAGGHAILCKGVNITDKYFVLHNSWGSSWGSNGDAKISFNEMKRLLSEDGEAVIPLVRSTSLIDKVIQALKSVLV